MECRIAARIMMRAKRGVRASFSQNKFVRGEYTSTYLTRYTNIFIIKKGLLFLFSVSESPECWLELAFKIFQISGIPWQRKSKIATSLNVRKKWHDLDHSPCHGGEKRVLSQNLTELGEKASFFFQKIRQLVELPKGHLSSDVMGGSNIL